MNKIPYAIALCGMIAGVFIAILFGVNEDMFKEQIKRGLNNNPAIIALTDPIAKESKISSESSKLWRYYQRFHFHSTGIGAMSLALLILLAFIKAQPKAKLLCGYCIAVGGFLYPFVWLLAAIYGSESGRHAAKETFAVFGWMGGIFLIGIIFELFLLLKYKLEWPHSSL